MDATPTTKTAYWLGYKAFRDGLSAAEAVKQAIWIIEDDSFSEIAESARAGWHYASVTAYQAARFPTRV